MPTCNRWGISASIVTDDGPLEEFCTSQQDNTTGTWITSEPGKIFHVEWSIGNQDSAWLTSIMMDGNKITWFVKTLQCVHTTTKVSRGLRISENQVRPYAFSAVKLTDEESLENGANIEELGTISLIFERVNVKVKDYIGKRYMDSSLGHGPIYEQSKKVISHRVSLQNPQVSKEEKKVFYDFVRLDDKPAAILRFSYRPKVFLQAQGIIPPDTPRVQTPDRRQSSSPVQENHKREEKTKRRASTEDPELDEASMEAIRLIKAQQSEMMKKQAELQKTLDKMLRPSKRVKREERDERIKPDPDAFKVGKDGVIDLTDL